jgi:hypothetical protein
MWNLLNVQNARSGVRDDFRKLYGALRSMGMEIGFDADRDTTRARPFDDSWVCELRFGHRIWTYRFSPRLMESSVDAQHHMIETVCTGAQQLFMEVALDNVMDNEHSVMPHRNDMMRRHPDGTYRNAPGGNALRYAASQRIVFEDLDRNPPLTVDHPTPMRRPTPRTDRPGFHSVIRPAADYRVQPPSTADLRAGAGADLEHLDVQNEHLDDAPAPTTFGPTEEILERNYRV